MERRTNAASDQTKHALAVALKELMVQEPIDRITIHELTERCGIRRQNFYYHFADVYDLLRWMFQEEAVALLKQHEGTLLWQEGLLQLFHYIEDNRAVCLCALRSVGRDHLKRFFEADIRAIIHRAVEQIGTDVGAVQAGVTPDDIALLTHIYVVASAGGGELAAGRDRPHTGAAGGLCRPDAAGPHPRRAAAVEPAAERAAIKAAPAGDDRQGLLLCVL